MDVPGTRVPRVIGNYQVLLFGLTFESNAREQREDDDGRPRAQCRQRQDATSASACSNARTRPSDRITPRTCTSTGRRPETIVRNVRGL